MSERKASDVLDGFAIEQSLTANSTHPLALTKDEALRQLHADITAVVGEDWKPRNPDNSRALGYNDAKAEIRTAINAYFGIGGEK